MFFCFKLILLPKTMIKSYLNRNNHQILSASGKKAENRDKKTLDIQEKINVQLKEVKKQFNGDGVKAVTRNTLQHDTVHDTKQFDKNKEWIKNTNFQNL